ncbi:unnamed protein product [Brachionus calyciflorus]|uniref:Uncharacterized protein n=1 Tax=Brachionus calyciflorus TaxID=104777 RepID=A0A814DFA2_9BILA|nr:unnamed protein product [Brachionus calyciflorus]
MYPSRPVESECEFYNNFYEKANKRYCQGLFKPDEPIEVCRLEEIPENLEGVYGRVKIFDDVIYLHQESEFNCMTKLRIFEKFNQTFRSAIPGKFDNSIGCFPIFNRYSGGSIYYKYPHFSFSNKPYYDENVVLSALMKGEKKLNEGIKIDCPMTILDWKRDKSYLALFNVKQMDVIEYTNDDFKCEKPLEFEIPGSVFDHLEPILTRIQFGTIREIKKEWDDFTNEF